MPLDQQCYFSMFLSPRVFTDGDGACFLRAAARIIFGESDEETIRKLKVFCICASPLLFQITLVSHGPSLHFQMALARAAGQRNQAAGAPPEKDQ